MINTSRLKLLRDRLKINLSRLFLVYATGTSLTSRVDRQARQVKRSTGQAILFYLLRLHWTDCLFKSNSQSCHTYYSYLQHKSSRAPQPHTHPTPDKSSLAYTRAFNRHRCSPSPVRAEGRAALSDLRILPTSHLRSRAEHTTCSTHHTHEVSHLLLSKLRAVQLIRTHSRAMYLAPQKPSRAHSTRTHCTHHAH